MAELRKYNTAGTILFPLIDRDAADFKAFATFVAGDTKISKDEGSFANTGSLPTYEGNGIYSLPLTATEMQAARIVVTVIDQSNPKVWEDQAILIETYGNASAQHAFDLDDATPAVDLTAQAKADVNIEVDTALSDYDPPTKAELNTHESTIITWLLAVEDNIRGGDNDSLKDISDQVDALNDPTAAAIADEMLKRPISNVEPSAAFRTLYGAIASLVNRRRIVSGNVEIFRSDDAGVLASIPATTNPNQQPITELDPP